MQDAGLRAMELVAQLQDKAQRRAYIKARVDKRLEEWTEQHGVGVSDAELIAFAAMLNAESVGVLAHNQSMANRPENLMVGEVAPEIQLKISLELARREARRSYETALRREVTEEVDREMLAAQGRVELSDLPLRVDNRQPGPCGAGADGVRAPQGERFGTDVPIGPGAEAFMQAGDHHAEYGDGGGK